MLYIRGDGNVGIGTTSPTALLHLKAGTATAGTSPLKFTSGTVLGTTEAGAVEYDGSHLYFTATNAGTRYQLDQQSGGGGLTIGTSTITSGSTGNILYNNAGVLGEMTTTGSGTVLALATTPTFTTNITTPLVLGGSTTTSSLTFQTTSGVGTTGADMHFKVGNNGGTEAMTILNTGNVGIGTTTPGAQLHLYKSVNSNAPSLIIENANPSGNQGDAFMTLKTRSSDYSMYVNDDTNFFTITDNSQSWPAKARLFIDGSGNVGIGSMTPLSKLSINGGLHVGGDSDAGDNNLLVDGNITSSGDIVAGMNGFNFSDQTNIATTVYSNFTNSLAYSPFGSTLWHDKLRFSNESGTPLFETYNGSWSTGTLDKGLFIGQNAHDVQQIDGTTKTAARWTWNNATFAYGQTHWWVIGVTYVYPASSKNFLIETSSDGITWTTLHTSTGNTANSQPVILYTPNNAINPYMRLTITVTNGQPLRLSSIQALSNRTGGQFMGSETIYPYTWDENKNVFFSGNMGIGTSSPTAALHLKAGTATANTAPLKLTSGTNLTTTEAGAIEYNGTHLYFTATNGGSRYQLDQQSVGGGATWDTIGDPAGNGSIAMGSTIQTMDWGTATTQNVMTLTSYALTTGRLLDINAGDVLTSGNGLMVSSGSTGNFK